MFAKSKRLVEYVNKSSKKQLFNPRLKQEVSTRFESFYNLLSSIKENTITFELLKDEKVIYDHFNKINITVLTYVLKIVKIFEESRLRLGCTKTSTFHLVYGIYHVIKRSLNNIKEEMLLDEDELFEEDEKEELSCLINLFLDELENAYLSRMSMSHKICSLLTPQFVGLVSEEADVM